MYEYYNYLLMNDNRSAKRAVTVNRQFFNRAADEIGIDIEIP